MSLGPDPALEAARARIGAYLGRALERAGDEALRLFADQVGVEHLLRVLLEDEDSALNQLVEHAFADAETLSADVLAIAPGILVVGSGATLPFSTRSVDAMRRARAAAATGRAAEVTAADVLREAAVELEPEASRALAAAGFVAATAAPAAAPDGAAPVAESGHLFHHFSADARRVLSRAGRVAQRAGDSAIAPAHLFLAALELGAGLEQAAGLSHRRATLLVHGHTADERPPPPRHLPPDPELIGFLRGLPDGADSLAVLEAVLTRPSSEQAQIFTRQKVTEALLERARGVLADPD